MTKFSTHNVAMKLEEQAVLRAEAATASAHAAAIAKSDTRATEVADAIARHIKAYRATLQRHLARR